MSTQNNNTNSPVFGTISQEEREAIRQAMSMGNLVALQEEDTAMQVVEESAELHIDLEKIQEDLHQKKKAAADKLIWVLANLQGTQQEQETAQAELDAAKTAWNAFLEAKK
ncbi:hypothetical protein EC973_007965, partial [Apophysomyces ossiformis]